MNDQPINLSTPRRAKQKTFRDHFRLVGALGLLLFTVWIPDSGAEELFEPGSVAPDISLPNWKTGERESLYDFSGKIVVLDFFAHWCPPCRESSPALKEDIQAYYDAAGGNPFGFEVEVVGVNVASVVDSADSRAIEQFIETAGLDRVWDDSDHSVAIGSSIPVIVVISGVDGLAQSGQWEVVEKITGWGGRPSVERLLAQIDNIGNPELRTNLQLADSVAFADESDTTATIAIERTADSGKHEAVLEIETTDDTAKAGEDFRKVPPTTVVLPEDVDRVEVTVELLDNSLFEAEETFFLTFRAVSPRTHIVGDDRAMVVVYHSSDFDEDDLPDPWETEHFGSTDVTQGDEDSDGDLVDNLDEYFRGTDPTDAESVLYELKLSWYGQGRVEGLSSDSSLYAAGTVVKLTAVPEEGALILGWSDDFADQSPERIVTMDGDVELQVAFGDRAGTTLDAPHLEWESDGDGLWFGGPDDSAGDGQSLQAPPMGDGGAAWVYLTLGGPGTLSFDWKTSSEQHYDYLDLYVNGYRKLAGSGETDWNRHSITLTGTDTHVLAWVYSKDGDTSEGEDTAWLNNVRWEPDTGSRWFLWAADHFSAEELHDSSVGMPHSDPDGDGVDNAQELVDETDPRDGDSAKYSFEVAVVGHGTVAGVPAAERLHKGTSVPLQAIPSGGLASFFGWTLSGGLEKESSVVIEIAQDLEICAVFDTNPEVMAETLDFPKFVEDGSEMLDGSGKINRVWMVDTADSVGGSSSLVTSPPSEPGGMAKLELEVYGPGTLSFHWKTAAVTDRLVCEASYPDFSEHRDFVDALWGLSEGWEKVEFQVPRGFVRLHWDYHNASFSDAHLGKASLDNVRWEPSGDDPYYTYLAGFLNEDDLQFMRFAAGHADPDHDGTSNEAEWVFQMNPLGSDSDRLPAFGTGATGETFQFVYRRLADAAAGLDYRLEASATLDGDWSVLEVSPEDIVTTAIGDLVEEVAVKNIVKGPGSRFFRMRVSRTGFPDVIRPGQTIEGELRLEDVNGWDTKWPEFTRVIDLENLSAGQTVKVEVSSSTVVTMRIEEAGIGIGRALNFGWNVEETFVVEPGKTYQLVLTSSFNTPGESYSATVTVVE